MKKFKTPMFARVFNRKVFPQSCHFDEGEIFASSSAIKIANLCRVTCEDFSFVEMTNYMFLKNKIREFVAKKTSIKKIPNPNRKIGIWNFYIGILK
ncbi:hypothetical protein ASE40_01645 [Flavobacterium sp. Root935]|nr:hypothetical protein ASE40_01645 [Flavobacterium sp. Root935]